MIVYLVITRLNITAYTQYIYTYGSGQPYSYTVYLYGSGQP